MIDNVSTKIIGYLVSRSVLDANNQEVIDYYHYGVEITISSIINILLILLLSAIFDSLMSGLIFLAVFVPTRQYTGGYHADSYIKCNAVFSISFLCVLLASRFIGAAIPESLFIISLGISTLVIFVISPVPNHLKPMSMRSQYWKCKLTSIIFFGVYSVISVFYLKNTVIYRYMVFFTLHLIAVLGILGMIKERRLQK